MAAPTIVSGHTTLADAGSTTTHTINTPTHSEGDVIYIFVGCDGVAGTLTKPDANWTVVPNMDSVTIVTGDDTAVGSAWYKTAGASEPASYSFDSSNSERAAAIAFAVNNDGGIDVSGTPNEGQTGPGTCPSVNTTVVDTLIIRVLLADQQGPIPTGCTAHTQLDEIDSISGATAAIYYTTQAGTGATGTADITFTVDQEWIANTVAIAPAAAAVRRIFITNA